MTELSLQIERTAKEASFAMLTLATMSIILLLGASIAVSFRQSNPPLSMNRLALKPKLFFQWNCSAGLRRSGNPFWTFWAVTGPLTGIVLTVWLIWLKVHRRREDQKSEVPSDRAYTGRKKNFTRLEVAEIEARDERGVSDSSPESEFE
ncbi:hypothetical protein LY78DRAFT_657256 [Colletotrichum sublineola]|nr:hypothetical protein LY78DRAFT_657256 [Colletotrichum sublineola]